VAICHYTSDVIGVICRIWGAVIQLAMPPWLCFKCLFTLPVSCVMFQKSVKQSTPNFCTPSRLNIFHSQLPTSHFSHECVQVPSFSEDSWRQALSASPRGQHRLRLLPLSASLPLPRGRGAQSSVWLSRAPRRGMASCKGRRVITARRPTDGAAHSCEIAFQPGPPCGHVGSDRSPCWRASQGRSPERRSAALWLSWSRAAISRRAQWNSMDGCDRLLL